MADQRNWSYLKQYAGRWIAWNRQQTQIVATGETFEAVKAAAAQNGEQSVLVAHIPPEPGWFRQSCRLLHIFAVFIALSQPVGAGASPSPSFSQPAEDTEVLNEASNDKR